MRVRCVLRLFAGSLALATSVWAGTTPIAVSPGRSDGLAVVEARCPSFSWGGVERARQYELVVFRVAGDGEEAEPVLRERFPASVYSWTPSLERCLERGGRYGWTIRAIGARRASEWSRPSLFRVAPGPGVTDLEEADSVAPTSGERAGRRDEATPGPSPARPSPPLESVASPEPALGPSPQTHVGTGGGIVVNGALVETKADPPCWPASTDDDKEDRYIDCGNGTVLDTVTGLLWLQNANCRSCPTITCPPEAGERNWWDASAFAANLRDGQCGVSDHSQPGDWRLPTADEWMTTIEEAVKRGCTDNGSGNPPSLTNHPGLGCLADGPTSFFDVQLSYWSSSSLAGFPPSGRNVRLLVGSVVGDGKDKNFFAWPVRGGQ